MKDKIIKYTTTIATIATGGLMSAFIMEADVFGKVLLVIALLAITLNMHMRNSE